MNRYHVAAILAIAAALIGCGPAAGIPCSTIEDCRAPAGCRQYTCGPGVCEFRDLAPGDVLTCPSPECHADADCAGLADFPVACDVATRTCVAGGAP